jgi:spore coat polysaccharide biosynthesis protein SpsF
METVAIIQVRIGSSRLPGKALYPLDGVPVLQRQIRRVKRADYVDSVVVATTEQPQDDIVVSAARQESTPVFRGSIDDVLYRVYDAAEQYQADTVVRISGDNPLVSPELLDELTATIDGCATAYATNKFDRTFPFGVEADAMRKPLLDEAERSATTAHHREHLGQYFSSVAADINWVNVTADRVLPQSLLDQHSDLTALRVTIDWPSDYELLRRLYAEIPFTGILPLEDAIEYAFENDLQKINTDVQQAIQ